MTRGQADCAGQAPAAKATRFLSKRAECPCKLDSYVEGSPGKATIIGAEGLQ